MQEIKNVENWKKWKTGQSRISEKVGNKKNLTFS